MYQPGQLIVYGAEGVCRVAAVGPLSMRDAQDGVNYYTLSPLYRSGTIYVPVDAALHTRPVMSREDAQRLIAHIPDVAPKLCESNNPRLLNEHYQALLKSDDCVDRVRLIRAVYAKGRAAAKLSAEALQRSWRTVWAGNIMTRNWSNRWPMRPDFPLSLLRSAESLLPVGAAWPTLCSAAAGRPV